MLSSRILQILGSIAIASLIGLVHANPKDLDLEPEYGAVSSSYRSEQGQNTNYAASQANIGGSHYGDDYMTIAESRPRRRSRPPPPRRRRGPPGKRGGPPRREEIHHHHGWGGKTEKIVVHHYHAKPQKRGPRLPRLKFIPFGILG